MCAGLAEWDLSWDWVSLHIPDRLAQGVAEDGGRENGQEGSGDGVFYSREGVLGGVRHQL